MKLNRSLIALVFLLTTLSATENISQDNLTGDQVADILRGDSNIGDVSKEKAEPEPDDYSTRHVFITFRKQFLKDPKGNKVSLKALWKDILVPAITEERGVEGSQSLVSDIKLEALVLQQAFSSYIVVRTDQRGNTGYVMKELCLFLKKRDDVLGCEYADKQVHFGLKASIDEMANFKSKVKIQDIDYDDHLLSDEEKARKKEQLAARREYKENYEEIKEAREKMRIKELNEER